MKTILPRKEPDNSTIRSPHVLSIRTFGGSRGVRGSGPRHGREWSAHDETLERRGVEVLAIPNDEIQKASGGIHGSTTEFVRAAAG
jgi:hypothetical protein